MADEPARGTLGALMAARGLRASGAAPAPAAPAAASKGWRIEALPKVVLRMERKGHGGKTVTCVSGLVDAPEDALDELARDLRRALGTGVRVEAGELVVQGEQRERVRKWLAERGVSRIVG